jgi:hypothetical protein
LILACGKYGTAPGRCQNLIIDPTNRLAQVYVLAKNGTFLPTVFHADHETFASAVFPGPAFDLTKIFPPQTNIVRPSPRSVLAAKPPAQKKPASGRKGKWRI